MQATAKSQAELQQQRQKIANSYKQLLDEFSSQDLRNVGNYTLGRLIGKGSFGKVYLASHKLTNGSKVVLKSARKDDPNLAREIHHHRQFLHPHIARLYEVIVTESLVWLALEFCPGDELYNYLTKNGPLEPLKVQRIFTQLVGAVSYVHNKSCVHRDLKLENILLDKHENVKLVDFGFTREYEGKSNYLQTWCGTICYSAPEMLKGEKYAGEKVDVWSLGIILYALLAGELPFDDDDENVTKQRILKEEQKYPDHFPQPAKELITILLSKRPLLRPTLADILQHPWLSEFAPQQQAILKLQQPPPFTTELEKETLQRMRSAGVNIDQVIENVLAQRCDALAGWWSLLIEKEERKAKRRDRRRKEREAESKSLRRLSAASSRLERLAEEAMPTSPLIGDAPKSRGRNPRRTSATAALPDLPRLPEGYNNKNNSNHTTEKPLPPIRDRPRSTSSSRQRPPLPPKEARRSRSSMLQVVATNPELLGPNGFVPKRRRRYQPAFLSQLVSLRNWFKESARRARSPHIKVSDESTPKTDPKSPQEDARSRSSAGATGSRGSNATVRQDTVSRSTTTPQRPKISTRASTGSAKRLSLSPSPITPRSSYRRSGLHGRKSTSSSISSIRSIHHHHSHSKASSTSSASITSPSVSISSKQITRSPHASVKVLPATPTSSTFPAGIRLARLTASESSAAFSSLPPPSPGLVFAKRKRSPFKGPMLAHGNPSGIRTRVVEPRSRSGSVPGRRSGEIIEEEEEEEGVEEEEIVEEVDEFPVITRPDEVVVELPNG